MLWELFFLGRPGLPPKKMEIKLNQQAVATDGRSFSKLSRQNGFCCFGLGKLSSLLTDDFGILIVMLPHKDKFDQEEPLRKKQPVCPPKQDPSFRMNFKGELAIPTHMQFRRSCLPVHLQHFYLKDWSKGFGSIFLFIIAVFIFFRTRF